MRDNNGFGDTIAVRHEIEEIGIYEVIETELDVLQQYSASDIYFDFAIATTTLFVSLGGSMFAMDFANLTTFVSVLMLSICISSGLVAIATWILWGRTRKDKQNLIAKIKSRKIKSYAGVPVA